MTAQQSCPNCGHSIEARARWEILNAGLVSILIKAIVAVHRSNQNRFHLQKDLLLSHNEFANFQKLRYFALIAHADKDNPKSGEWLITNRGGAFLRGEMAVPRKVLVSANRVIDHSPELVHINELKNKLPEFDPRYAYLPILMPPVEALPLFKAA